MDFLTSSAFWWHLGLIFLGVALAKSDASIAGVSMLVLAGVCFFISGALGVITDIRSSNPPRVR